MNRKIGFFMVMLLCSVAAVAQTGKVKGIVTDYETNRPVAGVVVTANTMQVAVSAMDGSYTFDGLPAGVAMISFTSSDYAPLSLRAEVEAGATVTLDAGMRKKTVSQAKEDNIMVFDESELEDEGTSSGQSASYLSGAADDIYLKAASYSYSPIRFNIRGYNQRDQSTYINGVTFNDLERGRFNYSSLGGLNTATRNKDVVNGTEIPGYAFGGLGGVTNINTKASAYSPGTNVSLAATNRSYILRGQALYATGLMNNGWAFTGSLVYRGAPAGSAELLRIDGMFYNSFGYFFAAEKIWGNHSFAITTFGAPTQRSQSAAVTQEVYDLRNIYYNPYWGYQDGKKRNSRVVNSYDPTAVFNYEWKIDKESRLNAGLGFHYSMYSNSALSFYNAPDPRPDYYRNMPSWQYYMLGVDGAGDKIDPYYNEVNKDLANQIAGMWRDNNTDVTQINWDALYGANYANNVENPTGSAKYMLERRHNNLMEIPLNVTYTNQILPILNLSAGIEAKYAKGMHYKTVDDLLGGNQWIDIDQFAERDFTDNTTIIQNDVDNPYRVVKDGDRFGYNYNMHVINASAFIQNTWKLSLFDIYYAARLSYTSFQREGLMRNGRAEVIGVQSKGFGKMTYFIDPQFKAGFAYKIDGHNRLALNAFVGSRAPLAGYSYVAPRIKDTQIKGLTSEKFYSADLTYEFNYARVKGRVTGFFTEFRDGVESTGYYHDEFRTFVNHTLSGVNKRHMGVELGLKIKLSDMFSLSLAGTYADYTYTNNCMGTMSAESGVDLFSGELPKVNPATGRIASTDMRERVYTKGLHVSSGPQAIGSIAINFFHPKMWFADITLTYHDKNYLSFSPSHFTKMNMYGGKYKNDVGQEQEYAGYRILGYNAANEVVATWKYDEKTDKPVIISGEQAYLNGEVKRLENQRKLLGTQERLNTSWESRFILDASVGKLIYLNNRKQQLNINLSLSNLTHNTHMVTGGYQQGRISRNTKSLTKEIQMVDKFPNKYYYAWGFNFFLNVGFKF